MILFHHNSLLYQMIMRIYWKDIWLKNCMGSTQVIESTVQHHLAPFCCLSLKDIEVVTECWILCSVWTGPLDIFNLFPFIMGISWKCPKILGIHRRFPFPMGMSRFGPFLAICKEFPSTKYFQFTDSYVNDTQMHFNSWNQHLHRFDRLTSSVSICHGFGDRV